MHTHTQRQRDTHTHHNLYIQTQEYTLIIINLLNKLRKNLYKTRFESTLVINTEFKSELKSSSLFRIHAQVQVHTSTCSDEVSTSGTSTGKSTCPEPSIISWAEDNIPTSAQFTNVSCAPQPIAPVPSSQMPQLLPINGNTSCQI